MGLDPNRYKNVGHGHVFPRPDRALARCGGPASCPECAADLVYKTQCEDQGKVPLKFMDIQWAPGLIPQPGALRPPLRDADRYVPPVDQEASQAVLPVVGSPIPGEHPLSPALTRDVSERQALCAHQAITWTTGVQRLGDAGGWGCQIAFVCAQCGLPFQVVGLPRADPGKEAEGLFPDVSHTGFEGRVARLVLRPFLPDAGSPLEP